MNYSALYGGSPAIGSIVAGNFAVDPNYLALDGTIYLKSAYPQLDYTGMTSFGSNVPTARTMPTAQCWAAIAFGNGIFVAVGGSSSAGTATTVAASSTDGITWTNRTIPSGAWTSVVYAAGLFVAVGYGCCATSPDGITWTSRSIGLTGGYNAKVAYGNGLFVAVSAYYLGTLYYTSPDGITWTNRTLPAAAGYNCIRFAGGKFTMLMWTNSSNAADSTGAYQSSDGLAWSVVSTAPFGQSQCLEYFKGRLFGGGGGSYLWAQTPITPLATGGSSGWGYLAGPAGGYGTLISGVGEWLFAAYSSSSTRSDCGLSTDGVTWNIFSLPCTFNLASPNAVAYGLGVLVMLPSSVNSGAYTTIYSWSADATKFRVPQQVTSSEADRLYIKAK